MADTARARPKRVHNKPWIELGMTKTTWTRTQTPWGKERLTKKAWLEKQGISPYHYEKLKRGDEMRAQMAREAEAEAAEAAMAAPAAAASEGHGQGTRRKLGEAAMDEEDQEFGEEFDEEEDYDDDDDDDDNGSDDGSPRRAGAPSPDTDADYVP